MFGVLQITLAGRRFSCLRLRPGFLPANGCLRVVSTNAASITMGIAASQFTLAWPADHTGWRLQVQTNDAATGPSTNWFDAADSSATNQLTLPVSPVNGGVFSRLIYP